MRNLVLAMLAACGGAPASTAIHNTSQKRPDHTCKQDDEALRKLFVISAQAQLDGYYSDFHPEPEEPDPDAPTPEPGASAVDPHGAIQIERVDAFENVLVVKARFGNDGLYTQGIAGIFVGCDYIRIAAATTSTPIDEDPTLPDALVKLGWKTATGGAKLKLARDFIEMLTSVAAVQTETNPDFGATFKDDKGAIVHTPAFTPATASLAADGSAAVDVWILAPATMGTEPDDPARYTRYHYAINAAGAVTVTSGAELTGDRPSHRR